MSRDFRVEAKAHRVRTGIPRVIAIVRLGLDSPHSLERLPGHRGAAEAVLQEKLGPLPEGH